MTRFELAHLSSSAGISRDMDMTLIIFKLTKVVKRLRYVSNWLDASRLLELVSELGKPP